MAVHGMQRKLSIDGHNRARSFASLALACLAVSAIACESSSAPLTTEPVEHASQAVVTATTPMGTARGRATATKLSDGRVLVAGGSSSSFSAEIYDPKSATWTPTGSMKTGRAGHSAVLLPDGRVLVVGGAPLTSVPELFSAGAWSYTSAPALFTNRPTTPLVVLPDGRVFFGAGGSPTTFLIYSPTANTWATAAAPLSDHAAGSTATLLPDGSVLVAGTSAAERYVPASDSWVAVLNMGSSRANGVAVAVPKGVLVIGGATDATTSELFSPATNTWVPIAPMPSAIQPTFATVLPSGTVLAGGLRYGFYDPVGDRWAMPDTEQQPIGAAAMLDDGSVLVAGGTAALVGSTTYGSTNPSTSAILIRQNRLGEACASDPECASGFCADGVCCNEACKGQCSTCSSTGSVGTCIAVSGAPPGGRAACSGAGSCGAVCDGIDKAVCHYPTAKTCSAPTCTGGVATSAGACDGAGACATTNAACAPFACGSTACNSACSTSADCATTAFCDGTLCKPRVANGGSCTKDDGCTSGHCADGVCCDTACGGQCEACDVTGRVGTCYPVSGAPHGSRPACDAGSDACSAKLCDGKNPVTCDGFPSATTICGAAQCTPAGYIDTAKCDGAGSCAKPSPKSCGAYACGSGGCKTGCATNDDCSTGFVCNGTACVPGTGATCSSDGLSSIAKDGTVTPCGAYRCRADGTCGTNCGGTSDCSPGNACDTATSLCTAPAASDATGASGGCAVGSDASDGGGSAGVLVVVLAGLAMRRRGASR